MVVDNVKLKKFLQDYVFSVFTFLNKRKKHNQKQIMLYSNMGFRDNIKALYDYIIEKEYYKKYKIFCSTNDYKDYANIDIPNVYFISNIKGVFRFFTAGYVYYCFGKIPIRPGKKQEVIHMWHATLYKATDEGVKKGNSYKNPYYTHFFATSPFFKPVVSKGFLFPEDKIIICGHPRNDSLFIKEKLYDFGEYDKLILWAPTFRKSKILGYQDTKNADELIPIITQSEYKELDRYLKEKKIKMVVKLHPMQDLEKYNLLPTENFILLSHNDFVKKGMELYRLCAQCDAVITDYSSIYMDYLLLNRPVAFTEDDLEDYTDTRGFAFDDPERLKPGPKIFNKIDLYKFIDDIHNGIDEYNDERIKVNKIINDYEGPVSCKRALESIGISL